MCYYVHLFVRCKPSDHNPLPSTQFMPFPALQFIPLLLPSCEYFLPPLSRHRRQQRPTRISLYIKASSLFTSSLSSLYVLQKRVIGCINFTDLTPFFFSKYRCPIHVKTLSTSPSSLSRLSATRVRVLGCAQWLACVAHAPPFVHRDGREHEACCFFRPGAHRRGA